MTLERAHEEIADSLEELRCIFSEEKYELTFVARYKKGDLDDADIVVTSDTLPSILKCIQRRIENESK